MELMNQRRLSIGDAE